MFTGVSLWKLDTDVRLAPNPALRGADASGTPCALGTAGGAGRSRQERYARSSVVRDQVLDPRDVAEVSERHSAVDVLAGDLSVDVEPDAASVRDELVPNLHIKV